MGDTSITTVIDSFDGIFKFVHSEKAKEPFLEGRKLLTKNEWMEATKCFQEAKRQCTNQKDFATVETILREMDRYQQNKIPDGTLAVKNVDWKEVKCRRLERFDENYDALPQGVFYLKVQENEEELMLVGRKTLSNLWLRNLIPEIFCSQIRPDMILGLLDDLRVTESKAVLFLHPISAAEKLSVFKSVTSINGCFSDLVFPFPLLRTLTHKELTSPAEGWDVDVTFDHSLSHGEEHIRDATVRILQELHLTSHRLYDPACSTGVFLQALKTAFPNCTTLGQDLSQKMCDVAKSRVDQVFCGSAIKPLIPDGSADCVFNRFLNSEVVSSSEAEMLLAALLKTVARGGVMITFGHTPVLLSSANFKMLHGFELVRCVAASNDKSSIFQYYIIRRID